MAEDPAVEARERDVDAGGAEVGDEDVAGARAEGQLAGRSAAGARAEVALDDEPALDELADPLGDDRPAEAGARDELRAGARPAEADLVEHRDEGVERLVRQRTADRQAHRRRGAWRPSGESGDRPGGRSLTSG